MTTTVSELGYPRLDAAEVDKIWLDAERVQRAADLGSMALQEAAADREAALMQQIPEPATTETKRLSAPKPEVDRVEPTPYLDLPSLPPEARLAAAMKRWGVPNADDRRRAAQRVRDGLDQFSVVKMLLHGYPHGFGR